MLRKIRDTSKAAPWVICAGRPHLAGAASGRTRDRFDIPFAAPLRAGSAHRQTVSLLAFHVAGGKVGVADVLVGLVVAELDDGPMIGLHVPRLDLHRHVFPPRG